MSLAAIVLLSPELVTEFLTFLYGKVCLSNPMEKQMKNERGSIIEFFSVCVASEALEWLIDT